MKSKTIKSILRRKIQHWADSIDDNAVKKLVLENAIVTGGALTSMLLNEPVNDYDVYLRTPEAVFAVSKYYLEKFQANPPATFKGGEKTISIYLANGLKNPVNSFEEWQNPHMLKDFEATDPAIIQQAKNRLWLIVKSQGVASDNKTDSYQYFEAVPDASQAGMFVEDLMDGIPGLNPTTPTQPTSETKKEGEKKPPYRPVFLTSNAITLSDSIQVVIRFFGEPEEIHQNYDFVHCTNYWKSWDGELVLKADALECTLNKELRYVGSRYPLCSLFRARKFMERGWRINAGQYVKMALQLSQLDLLNVEVLEDQLIGVDAAYFHQVVRLCEQKAKETMSDKIDYTYLVELIDRIF